MGARQVSGSRVVAAPPERIFALLTDPSKHPLLDGSGTVLAARSAAPHRLELGSTFGMDMRMGAPYKIQNTVVEYEPNRLIAWRHFNGHRWRWRLRPVGEDRTEVTETFDWSTARVPLLISLSPFPRKNKAAIEKSLRRLSDMFPA
ncbi:Polyketide cyclase / dehydrase and lipid transport [Amycolatopsis arida]|uniref:Polyketide cyclase / dehydrase and lipid transport n=1 Tax=Amycolatopsis arida TaxID=587909 RepID=A0A1I5VTP4_9PSEU|nr:SRPBCC family protein [Amycolatopsis arida]TDX88005.1 polyketide cyclase/dehydrase/lipid transport protein [Amycolatopsis arida]SFQ10336.1 Polyketide cyclase / dehydrase and lipid transport [Amycolatopsis arida]